MFFALIMLPAFLRRFIFSVCSCFFSVVFDFLFHLFQASRSEAPSDGALGESRKQLKEETLLRLVRFSRLELLSNY